MNKRPVRIIGGAIFFLALTFIGIFAYDNRLDDEVDLTRPNNLSTYYRDMGYFKIDPKTILASLESGDTNVFTPLLEDPQNVEALPPDIAIYWTQADFLKIASALSQLVWNDPMNLKDWSVYSITLEGRCGDSIGLDSADIAYFKTESKGYTTRLIEIDPHFGLVRWGDGKIYPKPILRKWKSVDLFGSKITADDALRVVCEDARMRSQIKDGSYGVLIGWPVNNNYKDWNLTIVSGMPQLVSYSVNLDTGDYIIRDASK